MELEHFTTLVDRALAADGLILTRPDPDDPLSGTIEPGSTVTLHHLYKACDGKSDSEAQDQIDIFVATMKRGGSGDPLPMDWDEVKGQILPILRDRGSTHSACLAGRAREGADDYEVFPHQEVGPELLAMVAVDFEESIATPSGGHLTRWGQTFETAYQQALANLAAREPTAMQDLGDGLYGWSGGDDYESSRLLLPGFLDGLPALAGDPVVLCPSKDSQLLTGADNSEGLAEMARQAAGVIETCRPLSALAIVRRAGRWQAFPGPDDAGAEDLRSLRRQWQSILYNEQKDLLEEVLEHQGKDIFVATYATVPQLPTLPEERSFTSWTEDVHAWLPETELVFFVRGRDDIVFAPWAAALEVLGPRMAPTRYFPRRFEVEGFPSEADFAAMGAEPLKPMKKPSGLRRLLPW